MLHVLPQNDVIPSTTLRCQHAWRQNHVKWTLQKCQNIWRVDAVDGTLLPDWAYLFHLPEHLQGSEGSKGPEMCPRTFPDPPQIGVRTQILSAEVGLQGTSSPRGRGSVGLNEKTVRRRLSGPSGPGMGCYRFFFLL